MCFAPAPIEVEGWTRRTRRAGEDEVDVVPVNPQEATSRIADSNLRLKDGEYDVRDG
jgi:hypothetical protein